MTNLNCDNIDPKERRDVTTSYFDARTGKTVYLKPLLLAAVQGRLNDLVELLQSGTDINVRDEDGRAALHWACLCDIADAAITTCWILLRNGLAIDVKDDLGESAFHLAAKNGQLALVNYLLEHGANPEIQNLRGQTPADLAVLGGHEAVVRALKNDKCLNNK